MPDVTSDISSDTPSPLKWVGMEKIAVPLTIKSNDGNTHRVAAKANVFVSLDSPESKGIHMSRVHLAINQLANIDCNKENLQQLLDNMISSQGSISQQARVELSFDLILSKPALLSDESGFQSFPVTIKAEKGDQGFNCEFELTIAYSSTCPCSASLARQLYANAIDSAFPDTTINKTDLLAWAQSQAGSVATPHSQRSYAYVHFSMGDSNWPDLASMIFNLEEVIGTPVQTAVKRNDEQEFARLNAGNLMFCEDAARRVKKSLEKMPDVKDYWFKIEHQESLHAHNAVVIDQK
jgi:GTP cyclohydrolase I